MFKTSVKTWKFLGFKREIRENEETAWEIQVAIRSLREDQKESVAIDWVTEPENLENQEWL